MQILCDPTLQTLAQEQKVAGFTELESVLEVFYGVPEVGMREQVHTITFGHWKPAYCPVLVCDVISGLPPHIHETILWHASSTLASSSD